MLLVSGETVIAKNEKTALAPATVAYAIEYPSGFQCAQQTASDPVPHVRQIATLARDPPKKNALGRGWKLLPTKARQTFQHRRVAIYKDAEPQFQVEQSPDTIGVIASTFAVFSKDSAYPFGLK